MLNNPFGLSQRVLLKTKHRKDIKKPRQPAGFFVHLKE